MTETMTETPDQYDEKITQITRQIGQLKVLRDAQVPDSPHHEYFQQQINELTDAVISWGHTAPAMRELDRRKAAAATATEEAENWLAYAARPWNQTAKVGGILGAFLILLSLAWCPTVWLPVAGAVNIVICAGCIYGGIRARRAAQADVEAHRDDLGIIDAAKDRALPDAGQRR